jgi:hypothetical protein
MSLAISIIGIVLGAFGHLVLLGLCVAGMPNSDAKQMAQIKLWMLAIAVVGIAVAAAGVWLHRAGYPGWCAAVNLASPVVMFVVVLKMTSP